MRSKLFHFNFYLLFVFIFLIDILKATPELDQFSCKGKYLTIDVEYRYYNDIQKLYYQSLTKNLDDFIGNLKSEGKLNGRKIHFEIETAIWMDMVKGIEMYRSKNEYYCFINGLIQPITQDYLSRIILYFTQDSWESFCYTDSLMNPSAAIKKFNKRIETILVQNKYDSRKILELNDVSVFYQNDSLICKSENEYYGQIKYFVPFSVGNKDFVYSGDTLIVLEYGNVINKIVLSSNDWTANCYEQYLVEKYIKWVNFMNGVGYFLSYSIEDNKFYKLKNL
jgi:hypothetical protein